MLNRKIAIGVSVPVMALALSATASFANSNEGTVTADALNVRSGPSTSYGITTKLYKGDKVEILETSNGWHKIKESNGKIGWVSGDYIKVSSGSTSQTINKYNKSNSNCNFIKRKKWSRNKLFSNNKVTKRNSSRCSRKCIKWMEESKNIKWNNRMGKWKLLSKWCG